MGGLTEFLLLGIEGDSSEAPKDGTLSLLEAVRIAPRMVEAVLARKPDFDVWGRGEKGTEGEAMLGVGGDTDPKNG